MSEENDLNWAVIEGGGGEGGMLIVNDVNSS